jgi:hypothetical protein
MVIKYFGPNDKTGVVWPPYTAADRRYAAGLRKWTTGPMVMVRPTPRSAAPAADATNPHTKSPRPATR